LATFELHLYVHLKVTISFMAMYYKQQQQNTRLHTQLKNQIDKHFSQPKTLKAAELAVEKPIVSFRWALFMVLTSGGCMAILLALVQRQNPHTIDTTLHARTLAFLGLASIILGCVALVAKRHKPHHA